MYEIIILLHLSKTAYKESVGSGFFKVPSTNTTLFFIDSASSMPLSQSAKSSPLNFSETKGIVGFSDG